jgi:rubrerythrin
MFCPSHTFNLFQIKKEFQDETSGYDNTINCSDWDEKDEDHFTLCSVAAPKQLCLTGSLNQQQANIKLENDDELPYSHDSAWNCNESNTEVSPSVNQYGTSDEEEQRIGGNMIGDNIQVTSAKNTSQNEAEERSRGNIRKGFPHNGTAISVFKNMVISYKEPQENMKEQKRTLKSNFSTGNICVNRVHNKTVTSEMNQNPKKQYTCHLCFQSYAGRSGLWQHLQKHSGRQYVCKVCNKHFTRGNILKQHERSHSKDSSNNTCPICKKTFLNEMQRKRHEIGHFIDWSNAKICT